MSFAFMHKQQQQQKKNTSAFKNFKLYYKAFLFSLIILWQVMDSKEIY